MSGELTRDAALGYARTLRQFGGWLVLRHGGRRSDSWRVVAMRDGTKARAIYASRVLRARQGGVALIDPTGGVERYCVKGGGR